MARLVSRLWRCCRDYGTPIPFVAAFPAVNGWVNLYRAYGAALSRDSCVMAAYGKLSLFGCLERVVLVRGMRHRVRTVVCLVVWTVSLSIIFGAAQTQGGESGPSAASCLQRSIPVAVLRNDNGLELQSAQLQVLVEGANATILSFVRTNIAPRIVLLVDTSSSMARFSGAEWESEWTVARLALDAIPPQSQTALGVFGGDVRLAAFDSKSAVEQALVAARAVKAHGRTPLYGAVEQSIRLFGDPQFGDAILIVSDGGDNVGVAKTKSLSNELLKRGIRCFVFLIRLPNEALTQDERQGGVDLGEIATATGGTFWALEPRWPSGEQKSELVTGIRTQIAASYRLDIALGISPSKPAKLKINTTAKGVELGYPRRIEACWSGLSTANP